MEKTRNGIINLQRHLNEKKSSFPPLPYHLTKIFQNPCQEKLQIFSNQFKAEIAYIGEISQTEDLVTEGHSFTTYIKEFGVQKRVFSNLSSKYRSTVG